MSMTSVTIRSVLLVTGLILVSLSAKDGVTAWLFAKNAVATPTLTRDCTHASHKVKAGGKYTSETYESFIYVIYQYSANNQIQKPKREAIKFFDKERTTDEICASLPTVVYYDPKDPGVASLNKGTATLMCLGILVGVALFSLSLFSSRRPILTRMLWRSSIVIGMVALTIERYISWSVTVEAFRYPYWYVASMGGAYLLTLFTGYRMNRGQALLEREDVVRDANKA